MSSFNPDSVKEFAQQFKTVEDILKYARDNNIKGVPVDCNKCIVAKIFQRKFSQYGNIKFHPLFNSLEFYEDILFRFVTIDKIFTETAQNFDSFLYVDLVDFGSLTR